MPGYSTNSLSLLFLLLAELATAQQNTFTWGPAISPKTLQECGNVKLQATAVKGQALAPPYYMFAYEPGGPTTSSNIGSDPNNLVWQVNHSAGKNVILQMADSQGNSGGVGPTSYPVNAGTSTTCHSNAASTIQLTTTSTSLKTCDPLVLNVAGGQMPYTVSIVATNSGAVTNATLGANDDQYTWINRAAPGGSLIAVAIDATGALSQTTNLIGLSGPKDTSCNNAQSSSGIQGENASSASATGSTTKGPKGAHTQSSTSSQASATSGKGTSTTSSSHTGAIIGGAIGGVIGAAAIAVIIVSICRKRRQNSRNQVLDAWTKKKGWDKADHTITPFEGPANDSFVTREQPPLQKPEEYPFDHVSSLTAGGAVPATNSNNDYEYNPYEEYHNSPAGNLTSPTTPFTAESYHDMPSPSPSVGNFSENASSHMPLIDNSENRQHTQSPVQYTPQVQQFAARSHTREGSTAGAAVTLSVEPASVLYARNLSQGQAQSQGLIPERQRKQSTHTIDEDTELAYRISYGEEDAPPMPPAYTGGLPGGAYPSDRKH